MKRLPLAKIWVIMMFLSILATLIGACRPGVYKEDYTALQKKLTDKEEEIATLKQRQAWSIIPNAPPRAPRPQPPPGTSPPPPPKPPAPKTVPLYFYVDTVTAGAGESKYNVDGSRYCIISSVFKRGQRIVWRMEL